MAKRKKAASTPNTDLVLRRESTCTSPIKIVNFYGGGTETHSVPKDVDFIVTSISAQNSITFKIGSTNVVELRGADYELSFPSPTGLVVEGGKKWTVNTLGGSRRWLVVGYYQPK